MPWVLVFLAVVLLAAGFFQSAAGFGFALLAVPLMSLAVVPKTAVVVVFLDSALMSVILASRQREHIDWPDATRLSVAAVCAMPVGVVLLVVSPAWVLRLAVGLVTTAAAIWMLISKPSQRGRREFSRGVTYSVGAISGILNTSLSTNGPPLVIYLQSRGLEQGAFRATISVVFTISNVVGLVMLLIGGAIHAQALQVFAITFVPAMIGFALGSLAAPRLRSDHFAHLVDGLLLVGGLLALAKSALG